MYTITTNELKQEVRTELQCPPEYIRHLTRFGVFKDLKKAVLDDDRDIQRDMLNEIRENYEDYCRFTGLDFGSDNRKARPGFFIMC